MDRFLSASATGGDWQSLAEACVARFGDVPGDANLGFIYATHDLADEMERIVGHLSSATGVPHWVGTVGMGVCADDREYYDTRAISALVGSFPPDSFRLFPTLSRDLENLVASHGDWCARNSFHFAVVHGDPRASATPELIARFAEVIPQTYLVGGLTSSEGGHTQYADHACEGSLSGVLFNENVPVVTSLTQGCSPIGDKRTITAARQNVVASIDGQPALGVFKQDIGEVLSRDLNRVGGHIFVGFPISGSDTGDYVVRNLLGVDLQNQELIVGDRVEPGQSLFFCRRDGNSAWEDLSRMLQSLKKRAASPIKGALYFSCLGRGRYLFGENSEELKAIRKELGEVPLAGFFANGEIANNRLYGYTGVLTLFL